MYDGPEDSAGYHMEQIDIVRPLARFFGIQLRKELSCVMSEFSVHFVYSLIIKQVGDLILYAVLHFISICLTLRTA
jgi:hypothetical protein